MSFGNIFYEPVSLGPLGEMGEFIEEHALITAGRLSLANGHNYARLGLLNIIPGLCKRMEDAWEGLSEFIEIGIPIIREAQTNEVNRYLNLTAIATFLSAVTATTLQFLIMQNLSHLVVATNSFWFISLIFSIASAVNSLIGLLWRQAPESSLIHELPRWASLWLRLGPVISLFIASATFSIGLCLYAFVAQHVVTSVLTVSLTVVHALGLYALARIYLRDPDTDRPRDIIPGRSYIEFSSINQCITRKFDRKAREPDDEEMQTQSKSSGSAPSAVVREKRHSQDEQSRAENQRVKIQDGLQPQYDQVLNYSLDSGLILVSDLRANNLCKVYDTVSLRLQYEFRPPERILNAAWSETADLLLNLPGHIYIRRAIPGDIQEVTSLNYPVQSLIWAQQPDEFYITQEGEIHRTNLSGSILHSYPLRGFNILSLSLGLDGERLFCIAESSERGTGSSILTPERYLLSYDLSAKELECAEQVDQSASGLNVSLDGRTILVADQGHTAPQIWKYQILNDTDSDPAPQTSNSSPHFCHIQTLHCTDIGLQPEFTGVAGFGGKSYNLIIAAGKDDFEYFVWNKESGEFIRRIYLQASENYNPIGTSHTWDGGANAFMIIVTFGSGAVQQWSIPDEEFEGSSSLPAICLSDIILHDRYRFVKNDVSE